MDSEMVVILLAMATSFAMATDTAPALEPPRVNLNGPPIDYLKRGQQYQLHCEAYGVPTPSVSWLRNGHPMDLAIDAEECARVTVTSSGDLVILPHIDGDPTRCAEALDSTYQCLASNEAGSALSNQTTLQLAYMEFKPHEVYTITASLGGSAKFEVTNVHSVPAKSTVFTWNKTSHGETIQLSPRDQRMWQGPGVLVILDVTEADAGDYRCAVYNGETGETSWAQWSLVTAPPEQNTDPVIQHLSPSPAVVTVEQGSLALLPALVVGRPDISVTWKVALQRPCPPREAFEDALALPFNPVAYDDRTKLKKSGRVLLLTEIQPEQSGCYQSLISGPDHVGVYVTWTEVFVSVPIRARLTEHPSNVLQQGGSRTYTCDVTSGHPAPVITWFLNSTAFSVARHPHWRVSESMESLTLTDADLEDTGVITCSVSNDLETVLVRSGLLVTPVTDNKSSGNQGNVDRDVTEFRPSRGPVTMATTMASIRTERRPDVVASASLTNSVLHVDRQDASPEPQPLEDGGQLKWWIIALVVVACVTSAAVAAMVTLRCVRGKRRREEGGGYEAASTETTQMEPIIVVDKSRGQMRLRRSLSAQEPRLYRADSVDQAEQLQKMVTCNEVEEHN